MVVNVFLCGVNLLIFHQHFNSPASGGAIRSYYLATALVTAGFHVKVITGSNESQYNVRNIDGIEVHYLPISYENSYGFLKRSLSFLQYISKSVRLAARFKNIDLCYAISTPLTVGVAAMRIKKKLNIPFIFEVGDLWPEAPIEMGFIKNPLLRNYLLGLEKKIYKNAVSVVALSPSIEEGILRAAPGTTVHQVPNMADTEFYLPERKNPELLKKFSVEGKFVISYIGALGFANGLHHFLNAAQAAKNANFPVQFVLCGDGAMRAPLNSRIVDEQLTNVTLHRFQNREGVAELMNVTDAAFISYLPFPILQTGSPNKYFDALAAGKMIITNFGGWIRQEIQENSLGFSFDNNPDEFLKKLQGFLNNRDLVEAAQTRSREMAENKYSRKLLSDKFAEIIREAIQARKKL